MDVREIVVRMGGGWNWLRIVSRKGLGISGVEPSVSTLKDKFLA
jgi:hypothetical protein